MKNRVRVRKADCPVCKGSGVVAPPPNYKSVKCSHMVGKAFLEEQISMRDKEIDECRARVVELSKDIVNLEMVKLKYFSKEG